MADTLSKERRSWLMSRVKGKNTKPELFVRSLIFKMGYRYRLHDKKLPGTPDIVFKRRQKVIFVHGCFWHGHIDINCKKSRLPKSDVDYWKTKIEGNIQRDKINVAQLKENGWRCLIIWECELKDVSALSKKISAFLEE